MTEFSPVVPAPMAAAQAPQREHLADAAPAIGAAQRMADALGSSLRRVASISMWEWKSLFLRPTAYFLLLLSTLLAAWNFASTLNTLSRGSLVLRPGDDPVAQFLGPNLLLVGLCTMLVPLLTMNLIADERRRGAWEALTTAAVTRGEIMLGKFLAGWTSLLAFLTPWLYFLLVLRFWGNTTPVVDLGPVFAGFLGLAVLGSTYTAFGMLCSALCRNPLSAAVLSFGGMAAILLISLLPRLLNFWQFSQEFVSAAEWISCWGLQDHFSQGRIAPRALVGHISVSIALLALAAKAAQCRDDG